MGSSAASGGYYIASAGSVIYANPLTITGSIGIFYGKADVSELFSKIGINTETYKTSPRADGESMYRPYTEDEIAELQKKVHQLYDSLSRSRGGRVERCRARRSTPWARGGCGRGGKPTIASSSIAWAESARRSTKRGAAPVSPKTRPSSICRCPRSRCSDSRSSSRAEARTRRRDVALAEPADGRRAGDGALHVFAPDEPLARMEYIPLGDL